MNYRTLSGILIQNCNWPTVLLNIILLLNFLFVISNFAYFSTNLCAWLQLPQRPWS